MLWIRPLSVPFLFRASGKGTDMATMLRLEKYGKSQEIPDKKILLLTLQSSQICQRPFPRFPARAKTRILSNVTKKNLFSICRLNKTGYNYAILRISSIKGICARPCKLACHTHDLICWNWSDLIFVGDFLSNI